MIDKDLFRIDPLYEAEKVTGRSYKEDKLTSDLGMLFHLQHTRNKKQMLIQNLDTHYSMLYSDYIKVVEDLSFKKLDEWFYNSKDNDFKEVMTHWYHDAGIYLVTETFTWDEGRTSLNTAYLYMCWISDDPYYNYGITPSGKNFKVGERYGFQGNIDVREGLRFNVDTLLDKGDLKNPFPEKVDFLSIISYTEKHLNYENYMALMERKKELLPTPIKKLLNI